MQHLIGSAESLNDGELFPAELHQAIVRDDDEGIADLAQLLNTGHGLAGTASAFELERAGDNTDGQRTHFLRDRRHDRSSTGASAAALAGSHEDHIGALEGVFNFGLVVFCGGLAYLRVSAGTEAAGGLTANVELGVCIGEDKGLRVGVDGDELNALEAFFDHAVDGVDAAAADADDLDIREIVIGRDHVSRSHLSLL